MEGPKLENNRRAPCPTVGLGVYQYNSLEELKIKGLKILDSSHPKGPLRLDWSTVHGFALSKTYTADTEPFAASREEFGAEKLNLGGMFRCMVPRKVKNVIHLCSPVLADGSVSMMAW